MFLLLKSCISTLILICYILMYNVIVLPGSRGHYYLLSHPWHTCYSPIPWKQLDIIQPNFHKFFCKTWCLTCYFCPAWFFGGFPIPHTLILFGDSRWWSFSLEDKYILFIPVSIYYYSEPCQKKGKIMTTDILFNSEFQNKNFVLLTAYINEYIMFKQCRKSCVQILTLE